MKSSQCKSCVAFVSVCLLVLHVRLSEAQWDIHEDVALGEAKVAYKAFRDTWMVTFDNKHRDPIKYTLVVPQLCLPSISGCSVGQISFSLLTCQGLYAILTEAPWFNENVASDMKDDTTCPLSFSDMRGAQALFGHVMPEAFLHVEFPTSISIYNNETLLSRFHQSVVNESKWELVVRLLLVTEIDIGVTRLFTVHRHVFRLMLAKPKLSLATFAVQSTCRAMGLVVPDSARLIMKRSRDGTPVCVWECRVDAMRTPWNAAPSSETLDDAMSPTMSCRPLYKYFTAVEFAFIIDTSSIASVSGLGQRFYDELDTFSSTLESKLGADALVSMTIPQSDMDTIKWVYWVKDYIAFSHRNDAVLNTASQNISLVIEALQVLGHYTESINPQFIYTLEPRVASGRRYSVEDITISGIWFTPDVRTSVTRLSSQLIQTLSTLPHTFSPDLEVNRIAQVDIRCVHRLSLPYSNSSVAEAFVQRDAIIALEALCVSIIIVVACFRRKVIAHDTPMDMTTDTK